MEPQTVFGGRTLPPVEWPCIVGIDIGSDAEHDPWAIVLIAVSPEGALYQFDEVYGRGLLIADIAGEVHAKLGSRARPSMAYDYSNRQCALELGEHDIAGVPAVKEVRPGLFKVAQYMHIDPRLQHPFTGEAGAPRYYVASHCRHTITELTGYKYAKDRSGNSTEDPAHENSHSPDALRYAIHTFRPLPEKMDAPRPWQDASLNELSRMYWRDADKHYREEQAGAAGKWKRPLGLRFRRPAPLRRGL